MQMDVTGVKVKAATAAVTLFILWELIHHLFLMQAPMFLQHVVAVIVEAAVTGVVVGIVFRLINEMDEHRRIAERLARVIATAVGHSVKLETALTNITTAARMIQHEDKTEPPGRQAEVILQEAKRIEDVLQSLQSVENESKREALY